MKDAIVADLKDREPLLGEILFSAISRDDGKVWISTIKMNSLITIEFIFKL